MSVQGDEKYIYLTNSNYYLTLEGNAEGTMDYSIEEYDGNDNLIRTIFYNNLSLEKGTIYQAPVPEAGGLSGDLYNLKNGEGREILASSDTKDATELICSLSVESNDQINAGDTFQVAVNVSEGSDLGALDYMIGYDSNKVSLVKRVKGPLLTQWESEAIANNYLYDYAINSELENEICFAISSPYGLKKGGVLFIITFKAEVPISPQEAGIYQKITTCEGSRHSIITKPSIDEEDYTLNISRPEENDFILGDVNQDAIVNASDALQALRYAVKEIILSDKEFVCADVTKDNVVNASDALQILRYAVKEISDFK